MKINELRIGNYLWYENTTHIISGVHGNKIYSWWVKDGKPVIEYEMKDVSGAQVENPYMDVISQYEPIELTDEWLKKFRFGGRKDFRYLDIVGVQIKDKKYYIALRDLSNVLFHSVAEIKYVHQLQNLYFALTGEELTIKD